MKKTSVYLSEYEDALLSRLAAEEGTSRAHVLREAIAAYDAGRADRPESEREFALIGSFSGPGGSIADIPDEELMRGFGEQ